MTMRTRTVDVGDALGNSQIRLHRSASGEAFRVSLEGLSQSAKSAVKQTEALCQIWIEQGSRGNYTGELEAQRLIGREIVEAIAGTALVLAQKHIVLVAGSVSDISRECAREGKTELAIMADGVLGLIKRSERIVQVHGAANFWKHGHEEKLRGSTRDAIESIPVLPEDPEAFEKLLERLGLGAPNYEFRELWSAITSWAGEIMRDVQRELESKGVLLLLQHSDTGSRTWAWSRKGPEILTYDMADLFR